MNKKQQIAVLIGICISGVFLWIAFRDLQPDQVVDEIRRANIGLLLFSAVWFFASMILIALRWQYLLRAVQHVPLKNLTALVAICYMGNNIYPLRSGEALRIFLLQRNQHVPVIKSTTTVIVERVFDGLVMLTFILIPMAITDIVSADVRRVVAFTAPFFLSALALFFVLAARPNLLRRLMLWVNRFLPEKLAALVTAIGEGVIGGLEGLRSPVDLAGAIVSSYASWVAEASVYWIVMFAFDLDLSFAVALLVTGTVNLAGLLPASPGQIGVFEFFGQAVLIAAGVNAELALGYTLTVHVVIWLPVTLVGAFLLIRQGLGWSAIARARQLEEQAARSETIPNA